jgi:hypothetical protein
MRCLAEIQVTDVARECGLSHFESAPPQVPLQVLLAGYRSVLQDIQNRALSQAFIHNE